MCGLADILAKQGRLAEAEAVYRKTAIDHPTNVVCMCGLADVLAKQGRLAEAEAIYRKAAIGHPTNVVCMCGLGYLLLQTGRAGEALDVFQRALSLQPGNAYAMEGAARAGADAPGQLAAQSPATPDKSAPREPDALPLPAALSNASARQAAGLGALLGDAYLMRRYAQGAVNGARADARRIVDLLSEAAERNAEAAGEAALMALDTDDLDRALRLLRDAVIRYPANALVRYALARTAREQCAREQWAFTIETRDRLIRPWADLARLYPAVRPAALLGSARASANLRDGAVAAQATRDAFWRLASWNSATLENELAESLDAYFAGRVRQLVFGGADVASPSDLDDLGQLLPRLQADPRNLDMLEEHTVGRISRFI
jgi:tetratricopeptide (TPR) repeat protein